MDGLGRDEGRIITDARVFQEDWVPGDFRYRDGELGLMSAALRPIVDGEEPTNLFCWGPSGAGKTSSARYLLGNLREQLLDVTTLSVSCWSNRTRHGVLYSLLADLGTAQSLHPTATSSTELLDRLERTLSTPAVLILDEVDQLDELDVLYDLYHLPGLTLVMLANANEELFARMDDRLRSRIQNATRVAFDRYTTAELQGILEQRVQAGMRSGAVTDAHLRTVADVAVGNARDAIRVLAAAARLAESRTQETLSSSLIADAVPKARARLRRETIERLDDHQYVLYSIVREADELDPGTAYERYVDAVEEPRTRRTVRSYVTKLDHYGLIEVVGDNRGRRYRFVDPDASTEADPEE